MVRAINLVAILGIEGKGRESLLHPSLGHSEDYLQVIAGNAHTVFQVEKVAAGFLGVTGHMETNPGSLGNHRAQG